MNLHIAENIRQLRNARNMTQATLAKRVGVTNATISAYEVGARAPSFEVLIKLAQVFRVSTDNLLGISNRFVVDVTRLSMTQRAIVQDIVSLYEERNEHTPAAQDEAGSAFPAVAALLAQPVQETRSVD